MWPSFPGLWGLGGSLGGQGKLGRQGMLEEKWLCPGLNWSEECLPRWRWVSAPQYHPPLHSESTPGLLAPEEPPSHVLADT